MSKLISILFEIICIASVLLLLATLLVMVEAPYLEYPQETVITNLQSGHGYTKQSAAGTQTDDTVNFIKGSQSLKLETDGDGAAVFTRKSGISPTHNFSNRHIKIWLFVNDTSIVRELWLYLSNDSFASSWYAFKIIDSVNSVPHPILNNTWTPYTISFSEAVITGTPNRSDIDAIQLRIMDLNAPLTVNWGSLATINHAPEGIVSITFDDNWANTYTAAKRKMDEYHFTGTAYIYYDTVGDTNRMSLAQLKNLQRQDGWAIATHESTRLTDLSESEAETAIRNVIEWATVNGFHKGASHFALHNGKFDNTTLDLTEKYFLSSRTIINRPETLPPGNYQTLRVLLVLNTTTTGAIQTKIDNAIAENEWLIIAFHRIVTSPTVSTEYSIANFGTVIDYLDSSGVKVQNVPDVLGYYNINYLSASCIATSLLLSVADNNPWIASPLDLFATITNNNDGSTIQSQLINFQRSEDNQNWLTVYSMPSDAYGRSRILYGHDQGPGIWYFRATYGGDDLYAGVNSSSLEIDFKVEGNITVTRETRTIERTIIYPGVQEDKPTWTAEYSILLGLLSILILAPTILILKKRRKTNKNLRFGE